VAVVSGYEHRWTLGNHYHIDGSVVQVVLCQADGRYGGQKGDNQCSGASWWPLCGLLTAAGSAAPHLVLLLHAGQLLVHLLVLLLQLLMLHAQLLCLLRCALLLRPAVHARRQGSVLCQLAQSGQCSHASCASCMADHTSGAAHAAAGALTGLGAPLAFLASAASAAVITGTHSMSTRAAESTAATQLYSSEQRT
jgi:hypothetical protein